MGISPRVVGALAGVPRERFLPADGQDYAYEDTPLPIGHGQTISAPSMVAIMCDALQVPDDAKVLEVGAGCGYHAAVLARLASRGKVYTVERIPELAGQARRTLEELGFDNVQVFVGDGSEGLAEFAPYDRISVAAAAPEVPRALVGQLADGGRLAVPVGRYFQELLLVEKRGGQVTTTARGGVAFVPLIGKQGFKGL